MNFFLVITELAQLALLLGGLWFLKLSTARTAARLGAAESVLGKVNDRLQVVVPDPVPANACADETDVQGFVEAFYRELDLLEAMGIGTGDADADGSYPAPTAEELAALDASIANERFQPPRD